LEAVLIPRSRRDDRAGSFASVGAVAGAELRPLSFSGSSRKCAKFRRFWPQSKTTVLAMKTLALIAILALLTISGAAYTDQLLTSDQQTVQKAN